MFCQHARDRQEARSREHGTPISLRGRASWQREAKRSGAERSGAAVMVPGDARAARRDGEAVQRLDRNHCRGFCVAGKQHTTIISC